MKSLLKVLVALALTMACVQIAFAQQPSKVVVGYVTSWSDIIPDPTSMTHINYAFGHVNETFDGVRIDNPERLKQIVALKNTNPDLKVLLSIGGWGSGGFSTMARRSLTRSKFVESCARIVNEYGLDGIDIDWEYPTSGDAGIDNSPKDTKNFTFLMKDLRKALGNDKLLTMATVSTAEYIDFKAVSPIVDFVNIMSYDMGAAPKHHASLYKSEHSGGITTSEAVEKHIAAGVPKDKIVVGIPFYGRGGSELQSFVDYRFIGSQKGIECWDEVAQEPYLANEKGELILGYDNPRSIESKCKYIVDNGLRGGMYWEYSCDNEQGDLRNTMRKCLLEGNFEQPSKRTVFVLAECAGQHKPFSDVAIPWLEEQGKLLNFKVVVSKNASPLDSKENLEKIDLIIQMDFPPYSWSDDAMKNFIEYIEEGKGGYIGFHHATLLGEFDGFKMWNWFSKFMGGIRFKSYIAPLADGTVNVEDSDHPVMYGVDRTFVLEDDEWYTYDKDPRPNVHVLAHVDEASYSPASDVKMGDHPVVWVNENVNARNVYFQFGHSPKLFESYDFKRMFHNAIVWTLYNR